MDEPSIADLRPKKDDKVKLDALFEYQKAWIKDTSEVKVAEKSRRVGLTWAEAADDVLLASSTNGMDVYYISYNFEFTKEFISTCVSWSRWLGAVTAEVGEEIVRIKESGKEDEWYTCTKITYPSGHKIMGLPARAATIRGRQGKIVIDEAAFCDNLDELLKAAMAMLIWGGKVAIISTHNGVDNPYNDLIKEIRDGKKPYGLHRITITDALADGLYKRICQRKKLRWNKREEDKWLDSLVQSYGDGASEELFCVPKNAGTRYFSQDLVEKCMSPSIPVLRYEQTADYYLQSMAFQNKETDKWLNDNLKDILESAGSQNKPIYIGEDFARYNDLTVICIVMKTDNTQRTTVCNIEMRNVPYIQQLRVWRFIFSHLPRIWGVSMDSGGNGGMLSEILQQDYGVNVVNTVMITAGYYLEYMPILKSRFEAREITIPYSMDIIEDFRLVVQDKNGAHIPNIRTNEIDSKNKVKMRHGDTVVAELMVEHAMRHDSGYQPYAYEPVRTRNELLIDNGENEDEEDFE